MKLGLSLSGGGVKGAAHIGVIKAFEEEKIFFDYISGTSSGSIVATLYACGFSAEEMLKLFKLYGKKISYFDFRNVFKFFESLIKGKGCVFNGLNSGYIIEKIIKEACYKKEIKNINNINKYLLIPSVDLYSGTIYIFSSKKIRMAFSDNIIYINDIDIGKAVRASCSFPRSIFTNVI